MKLRCFVLFAILMICSVSSSALAAGGDTLRVLFTGDVLLDRGVRTQIERVGMDSIMSGVRELFRRNDAVMINLECPLSCEQHPVSKQIIFRADTVMASALRRGGVTHAALANNHSIDQGFLGLRDTHEALTRSGIGVVGYGSDYAGRVAPAIIRKGDAEVAVFNNNVFPLENWPRTLRSKPDILHIPTDSLCAEIQRFGREHPGCPIVVFLHWGAEFSTRPNLMQRMDAMKLLSAGACAVVGHHPHVVQAVQYVGDRPVFYSLGNFIFDQQGQGRDEAVAVELRFTVEGLVESLQHPVKIENCRPRLLNPMK